MKNFGPYRGVVKLDFASTKGKNLWIIWGANGAGKTHIYKAVKWCLYGWDPSPSEKLRPGTQKDGWDLLYGTNIDNKVPPDPYMYVYLWFEHEAESGHQKQQYLVKRRLSPLVANPKSHVQIQTELEVTVDGRTSDSPREAIEAILPVAASQFFMFHGEEIRRMSLKHGEDVQGAIELILEAQTFRHGRDHLDSISKQIERQLDEERASVGELGQYLQIKRQIGEKIDSIKSEIAQTQKELLEKKDRLENDVERKLRSHEASQNLMGQLEAKKQQLNQAEEDRKNLLARRSDLVSELPLKLILPELQRALDKKEEQHKRVEQQRNAIAELKGTLSLAEKILKGEYCICGAKLSDVSRTHLQRELQYYVDSLSNAQSNLEEEDPTYHEVRETVASITASRLDFEGFRKDLDRLNVRIDELKTSIRGIENDLADSDKSLVRQLQADRTGLIQDMARMDERIRFLKEELEKQDGYRDRAERNITRVDIRSKVKGSLEKQLVLSESAGNAFRYVLEKLAQVKRQVIEEEATAAFRRLTNKSDEYDHISVDESYDVAVVNKDGNLLERERLSTGEREIVALSFILGLMKASEKDAPLILDTFFAHLDDAHYTNIVASLPKFANQIVLVLTNVEYQNLRERASEDFFDNVAEVWQVVRDQDKRVSKVVQERKEAPRITVSRR
jgi:DNA sulfur modification protein DndD